MHIKDPQALADALAAVAEDDATVAALLRGDGAA